MTNTNPEIETYTIRIETTTGHPQGAGFVITPTLAVTCAHVVDACGAGPGDRVRLVFQAGNVPMEAEVLADGYHPEADVAFLRLASPLPHGVTPAILGPSVDVDSHTFRALGYPDVGDFQSVWAEGKILGSTTDSQGQRMLQLESQNVAPGMSGAPVLDMDTGRVVGMVTMTYQPDATLKFRDAAFAIPAETLRDLCPVGLELREPEETPQSSGDALARQQAEGRHIAQANRGSTAIVGDGNVVDVIRQQAGDHSIQIGKARDVYIEAHHLPTDVLFQAPPLPPHFVPRPEVSNDLKTRLLNRETAAPGILVVSAIHGLGGIGKSVLAAALAQDPEIQERFSDGVLWTTLGQNPDLLSLLSSWIQTLGDYNFRSTTVEAISIHLRTLLHNKAALLVVDDVWDPNHALPFQVGGSSCQVLITTRRADVADEIGADLYQLDVMTPEQSLKLLAAQLSRSLIGTERDEALRLAEAVGYLPLALELAAARVTRGVPWTVLHEALEEEIARLETLEGPHRKTLPRLEASFNLSLNALRDENEDAWRAFVWLGVLPEDAVMAAPMAATLWGVNQAEAVEMLELLWNDALLLSGSPVWIGTGHWLSYRVHDLLHDTACRLLTAKQAYGLGLSLTDAHTRLLERYWAQTRDGLWHTLPDDGYIHSHITWHLERAEWIDEIHALLKEETAESQNGWYKARNRLGQMAGYLEDVTRAWRLADKQHDISHLPTTIGLQCRYALVSVSLKSFAKNIPPELLGALVEKEVWPLPHTLAYARQVPNPEQRAMALVELAPHLATGLREQVLQESLAAARKIIYAGDRAVTFSKLALRLPEELGKCALQNASTAASIFQSNAVRYAQLIGWLILHLPEPLLPEALVAAQNTRDGSADWVIQDILLFRLAHLDHRYEEALSILRKPLSTTRSLFTQVSRADALAKLAPNLPKSLLPDAVETARIIDAEPFRVQALPGLIPYLPKPLKEEILQEALAMMQRDSWSDLESDYDQANALAALVPYLSEPLKERALQKALGMALATQYVYDAWSGLELTEPLAKLAPHLPVRLLKKALAAVQNIGDESHRTATLIKLTSGTLEPLEGETRKQTLPEYTLSRSQKVPYTFLADRCRFLWKKLFTTCLVDTTHETGNRIRGIPGVPQSYLLLAESGKPEKALATARELKYKRKQVRALAPLISRFPKLQKEKVQREVLELALELGDERWWAWTLTQLASTLSKSLLVKSLETTQDLRSCIWHAKALIELAPYLPDDLRADSLLSALRTVRSMEILPGVESDPPDELGRTWALDENDRIVLLAALAPHLIKLPQNTLYLAWCDTIHVLAARTRRDLLADWGALKPVLVALGGPAAIAGISCAIQDVGRWWP